ncbi:MAG: pantoate--beta-alanine ligase [Bdellovibrio sp.]|nr:pantoate--beta-alanine ligase [Bdellovibrio sp.]
MTPNTPRVFESVSEFIAFRKTISPDITIGFVPTMGALHSGHASLLKKSASENDFTVLSIFVNPTQFNEKSDFTNYPKTWNEDLEVATASEVDFILMPTYEQMYPDQYRYKLSENDFSKKLCGGSREGHFDGVLTIVMKLLNIVSPNCAYFGEKDYQQFKLIHDMAASFFMTVEVIPCPTLREDSGLAMSSRNVRLSGEGKTKAGLIYKIITESKLASEASEKLTSHGFKVDYVEDYYNRRFVAAFLEGVRLIDNVEIK